MVKNALQAQLLKAGLVDNKKAKKLSKQAQHEQRTGQSDEAALKAKIEHEKQEKLAKDQALNQEKQRQLEEKTLKANIVQMISHHKIKETDGDITYQFIDEGKIKKVYISQQVYNALVSGSLMIMAAMPIYQKPWQKKLMRAWKGLFYIIVRRPMINQLMKKIHMQHMLFLMI